MDDSGEQLELDGGALLQRLDALPGGPQLLELAVIRDDLLLIGGAARDLLLGRTPRELDVVVAGAAPSVAAALAASLGVSGGESAVDGSAVTVYERFGTALVSWESGRIDIAERRAESYAGPGALPEVAPGSLEQDLQRRDFTINAIAVALGGSGKGQLRSVAGALEDLACRRLRVMHARSFIDDPTRLLRLTRYSVRLGFEPDAETAALAAQAIAGGALATVSGARIGAELRLALIEPDAVATLGALDELGVLGALCDGLRLDVPLARQALSLLPEDGRADLLLLACLLNTVAAGGEEDREHAMHRLLDGR
jgi:tRNA nucleotidyltransferase (CCA-adding enzyme)